MDTSTLVSNLRSAVEHHDWRAVIRLEGDLLTRLAGQDGVSEVDLTGLEKAVVTTRHEVNLTPVAAGIDPSTVLSLAANVVELARQRAEELLTSDSNRAAFES